MITKPKLVVIWIIPKNILPVEVMVMYVPLWFPDMGARAEAAVTRSYRLPMEPISGTVKAFTEKKQRMIKIVNVWI